MKKLLLFFTLVTFGLCFVQAQNKQLKVEESGDGMDIYPCGNRHEAQVVFVVNDIFSLSFRSTHDDELAIETDSVGNRKTYSIVLVTQEPGVNYNSRELTIMANGFDDYTLPLNLKDRDKKIFRVSDPYSQFQSPFYTYQEKANEYFYAGEYQGARDYYRMAMGCPEYVNDSVNINRHIADCDSLIIWALQADEHERYAEWDEALEYYRMMMRVNSSNQSIREAYQNCLNKQRSDCEAEFRNGEHYMVQGRVEDLKKALECFQNVIDKKCGTHAQEAAANLRNVKRQIEKENDHSRVLLYDFGPNQFIGLTYSQCNNRHNKRHGGYFTLRFNKDVIDMVSMNSFVEGQINSNGMAKLNQINSFANLTEEDFDYDEDYFEKNDNKWIAKDMQYEAQMTFGWTNQLYRWFYIHYGFGYHGGGFYTFKSTSSTGKEFSRQQEKDNSILLDNQNTWTSSIKHSYSKINWFHAPAVEIGLIVKVYRFAIKGTYQYNYWKVGKDASNYESFLDKQTHKYYVGVGFNW